MIRRRKQKTEHTVRIPTGSSLLNLAISDKINGGYKPGTVANSVGDTSAGKTMLAMTMLTECHLSDDFSNYYLIYDDAERAMDMNIPALFGESFYERLNADNEFLQSPHFPSVTFEDFQYNIDKLIKSGKPFIYVLDSFDAITTETDLDKWDDDIKATEAGKAKGGTYGTGKAKKSSEFFRNVTAKLSNTGSFVYIISQIRDNLDAFSHKKHKRTGGKALDFYASYITWLTHKGTIKKKDVPVGKTTLAKVSKTKTTGKVREVEFDIYYEYGVDDISSMANYAAAGTGKANRSVLGFKGNLSSLVSDIEDSDMLDDLKNVTQEKWDEFEESIKLNRKRKYQ